MGTLCYTVPPAYDGQTAQNFLRRYCGLSWRMVVKLKTVPGGIRVEGTPTRTIDPVYTGQQVTLTLPDDTVRVEPMPLPLTVVYEDTDLLVVDKPPFLAVHPSAGKTDPTLANAVVAHFAAAGTPLSFRPLSRLDRNTSGLLPVAKHAPAAFSLQGAIRKTYYALVLGKVKGSGTVDRPIGVKDGCTITREVREDGKPSVTHYTALATDGTVSLLRVTIDTGRTHQIRVHMAYLGHPLAGDTMYGTDQTVMTRQGLHCGHLSLPHPRTGELLTLHSPLPEDMRQALAQHGLCVPEEENV